MTDSVHRHAPQGEPAPASARGPGRPSLSGEAGKTDQVTVRLTDAHRAELDALVSEGRAGSRAEAIRVLVEESAARRS